jgi:hypothetical protein
VAGEKTDPYFYGSGGDFSEQGRTAAADDEGGESTSRAKTERARKAAEKHLLGAIAGPPPTRDGLLSHLGKSFSTIKTEVKQAIAEKAAATDAKMSTAVDAALCARDNDARAVAYGATRHHVSSAGLVKSEKITPQVHLGQVRLVGEWVGEREREREGER